MYTLLVFIQQPNLHTKCNHFIGFIIFFLTIPLKTVKRYTTDDRGEEEEEEEMRN